MPNDAEAEKMRLEQLVAERFCERLGRRARFLGHNKPPAPDVRIEVDGCEVLLELARYREQCPHNEAAQLDQEFKNFVFEPWISDDAVCDCDLSVTYRRKQNGHFSIPSLGTESLAKDAQEVLNQLKALVKGFKRPGKLVRIRFDRSQKPIGGTIYVVPNLFGAVSKHFAEMSIRCVTGMRFGLLRSSLQTRNTVLDRDELTRVLENKLANIGNYRQPGDRRPLWLLVYTEGTDTGRIRDNWVPETVQLIRETVTKPVTFDAVWFANDVFVARSDSRGRACKVRQNLYEVIASKGTIL